MIASNHDRGEWAKFVETKTRGHVAQIDFEHARFFEASKACGEGTRKRWSPSAL
jgi:hypothetical protein